MPHRTPPAPSSDLLFVQFAEEQQYQAPLLSLLDRSFAEAEAEPGVKLVAFPRPFEHWYSIPDRVLRSESSAKESRLRWKHLNSFFHMCHTAEFFYVPLSARGRLYSAPPNRWSDLGAPQYLCVPTLRMLAYVYAR